MMKMSRKMCWVTGLMSLVMVAMVISQDEFDDDAGTMIFFAEGWNADKLDYLLEEGMGNWTAYMDADRPLGFGEFEDVWRARIHYKGDCRALPCLEPLAMEIGLSKRLLKFYPNATIEEAWNCTKLWDYMPPKYGFLCLSRDQKRKQGLCDPDLCQKNGLRRNCRMCFDARVRYFCEREKHECKFNMFRGPLEG